MSKLNVYHHELRRNEYAEFYLKYEADKVIQRLDNAVDVYKSSLKISKGLEAELSAKLCESKKTCKAVRRALWLARAERARKEVILFRDYSCLVGKEFKWRKIEKLCRAKAEECK